MRLGLERPWFLGEVVGCIVFYVGGWMMGIYVRVMEDRGSELEEGEFYRERENDLADRRISFTGKNAGPKSLALHEVLISSKMFCRLKLP